MSVAQHVWAHDGDVQSYHRRLMTPMDRENVCRFSRYGRKRIEGVGACSDRLFNVMLEILWTLCTCIPLSKGRFNFPGDYEIFHICIVMPELRRFSRLLDCGDMAASAGPDNSSQCEPSRQTRHGKTR